MSTINAKRELWVVEVMPDGDRWPCDICGRVVEEHEVYNLAPDKKHLTCTSIYCKEIAIRQEGEEVEEDAT